MPTRLLDSHYPYPYPYPAPTSDWPRPPSNWSSSRINTGWIPASPRSHFTTCWRWNRHSVPKRRLLILGRRGNTQKTIYHYYNTAKAYKLEVILILILLIMRPICNISKIALSNQRLSCLFFKTLFVLRFSVCHFIARVVVPSVCGRNVVCSVWGSNRHCGSAKCWETLAAQHHIPADSNPLKHDCENLESLYSHAPHNDVLVKDRPHVRRWSHKIVIYIQGVSKWLEQFGSWLYSQVWWRDL